MTPTIAFHMITNLQLTPIKRHECREGEHDVFWHRTLVLHGEGGVFRLGLFSGTEFGLMTQEEHDAAFAVLEKARTVPCETACQPVPASLVDLDTE